MNDELVALFTVIFLVTVVVPQLLATAYEIVAVPVATPVTTPLLFTVAALVLLLLQVPPPVASVSVVVLPAHTVADPLIAGTTGKEQPMVAMVWA